MKTAVLATLVGSAAAFAPQGATKFSTAVESAAMDELKDIAEKSNPVLKVSFENPILFRLLRLRQERNAFVPFELEI